MSEMICLIGLTGAGKTTIAQMLSIEKKYAFLSIGTVERNIAVQRGYQDVVDYERAVGLQNAYFSLFPIVIEELGRLMIHNKGIVIEGIYSQELINMIKSAFPDCNVLLINIACSRHIRLKRFLNRNRNDIENAKKNFNDLEKIKFEAGVNEILKSTRYVKVRNSGTIKKALHVIEGKL